MTTGNLQSTIKVLCSLSGLSALLLLPIVHADEQDVFKIVAGVGRQHDNNIFRLESSERSDNITTTYAGVRIDKPYSLQRFKLDFTVTDYRYQNNDFLDFRAEDYNAAWLWALTPYLTGTLSADRKQQLNDYRDFTNITVQNIRTTENQHFEADFSPHGVWHLLAGVTRTDQTNSQIFNEESDFSMNSLDAGVRYIFRSGSTVTFMGHERAGDYKKRPLNFATLSDTSFDESEAEVKLDWLVSGKSKINMRMAYVARNNDHFSERDFSGTVGHVQYTWTPTGKLQFVAVASSGLSSYETSSSSYTRNNTLSISPLYSITSKITARATASISERKYLGDGYSPSIGRVDINRLASLGVDWRPYRNVSIGGSLQRSNRSSSEPGLDFTDTTAGLSANVFF